VHVALIWAMARNRVIGRDNRLPWRLPRDMQFFVATTMGKPVIMGRRTFESMKAPLAGRTNIVVTSDTGYRREGVLVAHSLEAALDLAQAQCRADDVEEAMVIGGAEIYRVALPLATRLYVTLIDADVEGDTFFPEKPGSVSRGRRQRAAVFHRRLRAALGGGPGDAASYQGPLLAVGLDSARPDSGVRARPSAGSGT
jgi:dihydrofolate reductase